MQIWIGNFTLVRIWLPKLMRIMNPIRNNMQRNIPLYLCASMKVSAMSPPAMALNPSRLMGRNIPLYLCASMKVSAMSPPAMAQIPPA